MGVVGGKLGVIDERKMRGSNAYVTIKLCITTESSWEFMCSITIEFVMDKNSIG